MNKAEPKPYHHGDLRNALIAAGLKVLSTRGAANLNLREVARVAGVTHTAPYRHFADKEALVAAIAEDGFHKLNEIVNAVMARSNQTPSERIVALGQGYVSFALQRPDHFRVMFASTRDEAIRPELYALAKCGFLALISCIVEGQADDQFAPGDPTEFAKTLWSTMHGLAILLMDRQFPPTHRSALDEANLQAAMCVQTILSGLSHPQTA